MAFKTHLSVIPGLTGNPVGYDKSWIPAFARLAEALAKRAGMTEITRKLYFAIQNTTKLIVLLLVLLFFANGARAQTSDEIPLTPADEQAITQKIIADTGF